MGGCQTVLWIGTLARSDRTNLAPCFRVRLEKRHPVSDSKAKKHTLISGTSPYGTYMALPPPPPPGRVTWLFYHFFKLQVHILHRLENILIFNIWKLWLVRCDVTFSETSLILPKISKNLWTMGIPLWWFPDPTLKLNNSRTAWPIPAMYISFSNILNTLSFKINLFSLCSSPLNIHVLYYFEDKNDVTSVI